MIKGGHIRRERVFEASATFSHNVAFPVGTGDCRSFYLVKRSWNAIPSQDFLFGPDFFNRQEMPHYCAEKAASRIVQRAFVPVRSLSSHPVCKHRMYPAPVYP